MSLRGQAIPGDDADGAPHRPGPFSEAALVEAPAGAPSTLAGCAWPYDEDTAAADRTGAVEVTPASAMSPTDVAAAETVRSLAAPGSGAAETARAMLAWAARAVVSAAASRRAVRLGLTTPALGSVFLEVRVRGRAVQVGVAAGEAASKHLLAEAGSLAEDLAGRGYTLDAFLPRTPPRAILGL